MLSNNADVEPFLVLSPNSKLQKKKKNGEPHVIIVIKKLSKFLFNVISELFTNSLLFNLDLIMAN